MLKKHLGTSIVGRCWQASREFFEVTAEGVTLVMFLEKTNNRSKNDVNGIIIKYFHHPRRTRSMIE